VDFIFAGKTARGTTGNVRVEADVASSGDVSGGRGKMSPRGRERKNLQEANLCKKRETGVRG